MKKNTGFIFATKIEALPFIMGLGVKKSESGPFLVYSSGSIFLAVCGIGKSNAAMATSYLIWKYKAEIIYNIGSAGSTTTDKNVGDIFLINKIIEYDRPKLLRTGLRILKPDVIEGFETAVLATQDKAVISAEDRRELSKSADLADMEGAAVVHACRTWGVKCLVFKYVTDTPADKEIDIIRNIHKTAAAMYGFFAARVLNINA